MRKYIYLFLLSLAFVLAIMTIDLLLKYIIGYPVYGLDYKVHYRNGGGYWTNVWKPHSEYWNVEGGNVKFKRNNFGLPGIDINDDTNEKIALLGSSFVEAYQLKPETIASSIFSSLLLVNGKDASVLNLGCSGHDPYDSYMRLEYFSPKFNPNTAILVLNNDNTHWFKRHPNPLSFVKSKDFGKVKTGNVYKIAVKIRNSSVLASVIINALKGVDKDEQEPDIQKQRVSIPKTQVVTDELRITLRNFSNKCNRFSLVSIVSDSNFNDSLASFCSSNQIPFISEQIINKTNLLHGSGHLNEKGNALLGELLYKSYLQIESIKPQE